MAASIAWLLPVFTQLRKCRAGAIVLSIPRLKKVEIFSVDLLKI